MWSDIGARRVSFRVVTARSFAARRRRPIYLVYVESTTTSAAASALTAAPADSFMSNRQTQPTVHRQWTQFDDISIHHCYALKNCTIGLQLNSVITCRGQFRLFFFRHSSILCYFLFYMYYFLGERRCFNVISNCWRFTYAK